jgi:hypothetical protein
VPHDGRGVALEQGQRREDRGVAAAAGDDDLRARVPRLLDRLDAHHSDDVGRRVDIGVAERCGGRQSPRPALAQMLADGLL